MAAGLGFKTFTTGEVLTAADTNGYLMQGVLVFASAAARDAAITSPQEGQFAYLKDTNVTTYYTGSAWTNLDTTGMTNPMTTTGDMVYSSSGSTPARLGIGTTGQVLTVAGGIPSWASAAGGGKVLQVIMGSTTTTMTTSSSAFADTNLTATITPSSATSTVLVIASQNGCLKFGGTAANGMGLKLLRGGTDIAKMADAGMILASNTANNGDYAFSIAYLDTPATTSATTYKTQANASGNAVQMILQNGNCVSTMMLLEIGA